MGGGLFRQATTQQERQRDHGDERDACEHEVNTAPTTVGLNAAQKHRPDGTGEIIAARDDRHRDAAPGGKPVRNIGDKRCKARARTETDQQVKSGDTEETRRETRQRVTTGHQHCGAANRERDAVPVDRATDQKTAGGQSQHRQRIGQRGIGAADREIRLDPGHDDNDRPHADIGDRGNGKRRKKPQPGIAAVE